MVEEWNIGDEFEVISDCPGEHLKKGDRGKVFKITFNSYIYFNTSSSIRISRIKKISTKPTYELW